MSTGQAQAAAASDGTAAVHSERRSGVGDDSMHVVHVSFHLRDSTAVRVADVT